MFEESFQSTEGNPSTDPELNVCRFAHGWGTLITALAYLFCLALPGSCLAMLCNLLFRALSVSGGELATSLREVLCLNPSHILSKGLNLYTNRKIHSLLTYGHMWSKAPKELIISPPPRSRVRRYITLGRKRKSIKNNCWEATEVMTAAAETHPHIEVSPWEH